jgi:hypothetical protein
MREKRCCRNWVLRRNSVEITQSEKGRSKVRNGEGRMAGNKILKWYGYW